MFIPTGTDQAWPKLVATVSARHPGLPIVGYEHGESPTAAVAAGFLPVGRLRVWLRD